MRGFAQPDSLLLGTRNPGKLHEIRIILADLGGSLRSLQEFENVELADEAADSYSGNAIAKARFYAKATEMWALADDSGLEVEALGGAPGVRSARYAGEHASDGDRRELLLSQLARTGDQDRRARFVCAVAIVTADGEVLNVSEGICAGIIASTPRGEAGFGYDPLFVPDGYDKTFAELAEPIKNRISHRARALVQAQEFLRSLGR